MDGGRRFGLPACSSYPPVSFVVANLVIRRSLANLGRHGLAPFGWYRIGAGLALIAALTW